MKESTVHDFWTIFDKICHSAVDRATHVKGHKAKLALLRSDRHSIERSMPLATAENLLHTHSGQNFKISSKNYDPIFIFQIIENLIWIRKQPLPKYNFNPFPKQWMTDLGLQNLILNEKGPIFFWKKFVSYGHSGTRPMASNT